MTSVPQTAYVTSTLWQRLGPDEPLRLLVRQVWVKKAYDYVLNDPFLMRPFEELLARTHAAAPHIQTDDGLKREDLEEHIGEVFDWLLGRPGVRDIDPKTLRFHYRFDISPQEFVETKAKFDLAGIEAGVPLGVISAVGQIWWIVAEHIVRRWARIPA